MSKQNELKKAKREYIVARTIATTALAAIIGTPLAIGVGSVAWINYSYGRKGIPVFNNQSIKKQEAVQTVFHSNGTIEKDELLITPCQSDYVFYQSAWQELTFHPDPIVISFTQTADITDDLGTAINKNIHYERFIEDPSTLENFLRNSEKEQRLLKVENVEEYLAKEGVFSIKSYERISDEMWIESRITSEQRSSDLAGLLFCSIVPGIISFLTLMGYKHDRIRRRAQRAKSRYRRLKNENKY